MKFNIYRRKREWKINKFAIKKNLEIFLFLLILSFFFRSTKLSQSIIIPCGVKSSNHTRWENQKFPCQNYESHRNSFQWIRIGGNPFLFSFWDIQSGGKFVNIVTEFCGFCGMKKGKCSWSCGFPYWSDPKMYLIPDASLERLWKLTIWWNHIFCWMFIDWESSDVYWISSNFNLNFIWNEFDYVHRLSSNTYFIISLNFLSKKVFQRLQFNFWKQEKAFVKYLFHDEFQEMISHSGGKIKWKFGEDLVRTERSSISPCSRFQFNDTNICVSLFTFKSLPSA